MPKSHQGSVRIGPISLLTLISVLLLAVLGMLCVTTTSANNAMANRQAESTAETYAIDACGQALLSAVNDQLQEQGSAWGAASAIDDNASAIAAGALETAKDAGINTDGLTVSLAVSGTSVTANIASTSGKTLNAVISLNSNLTYSINEWKTATSWENPEETLWSGSSASL